MSSRDTQPKQKPEETMNWADYADALARPVGPAVVTTETIKGRRLRDQFRDEITIVRVEQPIS